MGNFAIFTSCIGHLKHLPQEVVPLFIVLYPPKKVTGILNVPSLAPTKETFYAADWEQRFERLLKTRRGRMRSSSA